ncbi:MAG: SRPBCC domain-containing protein [Caldilineaceae bacterium]
MARLVYTESMADEAGNVLSPSAMGMPPGYPETTEVTVQLEEMGGRTKMVMTHAGIPADSPGAGGWNMAFDKLAAQIEAAPTSK